MKAKASAVAQKLLNLYRQEHVIVGGWAAVNRVFIAEATQEVISELHDLPTGKMLVAHIANLHNGTTPMDSIARELLPYGGLMAETSLSVSLSDQELTQLTDAINEFSPDRNGLKKFVQTPIILHFGEEWVVAARNALAGKSELLEKFDKIVRNKTAYDLWDSAKEIINNPINDRVRAQLQVDMPEYETYLPMFGDAGYELLNKLRNFTSSLPAKD
ncbi:MAG: hypothetical protein K6B71_03520 [Alphaproteobacteria bacterium]|nr:hypothetical protein [Alphaproteobacteria bacterium]